MQIYETQGISTGLLKISSTLSNIISDLFFTYYPHAGSSVRNFSYPYLQDKIHKKDTVNGRRVVLETTIDPKWNNGDASAWLSNYTKIYVDICYYKTIEHKDSIRPLEGLYSSYRILSSGKSRGIVTICIDTYDDINFENDIFYAYITDTVRLNAIDSDFLTSYIQHELQHLHISKNFHNDVDSIKDQEYNTAYNKIVNCMNMHGMTSVFAEAIYKYCIQTEFQTHLNQFYAQYNKKDLKSSKIYRDALKDLDFFKTVEIPDYAYNTIYANLYRPYMTLFPNLQKYSSVAKQEFVEHLKNRLIYRINKFIFAMHRAVTVSEALDRWDCWYRFWGSGLCSTRYNSLTESQNVWDNMFDKHRLAFQKKDLFFQSYL